MKNDSKELNWLVIVNPNAGGRRARREWPSIKELLDERDFKYTARFTERKKHAIQITTDSVAEGFRNIIVVGGDGTMNEVINGIFTQKICKTSEISLGMITVGTGNDWGRMFNIPADYGDAIGVISTGNYILQDAGIVHFQNESGSDSRYFVNIAGLGFDAIVVKRTNSQKDRGRAGKSVYYWQLLKSLFLYRSTHTRVVIDDHETSNDTFSISLGIGKYSGGGMMQTPNAMVNDGLFDITIIKRMRKGEIIRSLKMLYDGSILNHPKIEAYTGRDIKIFSEPVIHVEADGESLGHSPIEFEIIPESVRVICRDCQPTLQ